MRQGQQGRRGRGRGRKVQNPLSRNYESNGPDVKIRGTASHIAEKYGALARDAQASGDVITAENYLQHAEHYNRIIMAAQAQMAPTAPQPTDGPNGSGGQRPRRTGGPDGSGQPLVTAQPDPAIGAGESGEDAGPARTAGNGADAEEPAATSNGSGHGQDADTSKSSDEVPPDSAVA